MERFADFLFETASFMPHGYCLVWRPDLVWLHGASDAAIMLAYFSIPAAILHVLTRRPDMLESKVAWLFIVFISLCGVTHGIGLMTIWMPVYGAQGLIKAMTAGVSVVTAIMLWRLMPTILSAPTRQQLIDATAAISDHRELEAELQRSNRELERFASIAAHDLRAPLRAVTVISEWIDEEIGVEKPDHELLADHTRMLRTQAGRMSNLVHTLLEYARIGDSEAAPVEFDSAVAVRECISLVSPPDGLRVSMEGRFPVFCAVKAEFELVVRNLVSNAIKYHDREQGSIVVRALGAEGRHQVFEVEDDGPGIAPEMAERVFKPFVKLESSDTIEGSGLGLAMVTRAVEVSGGEVALLPGRSARGAVFRFSIGTSRQSPRPAMPASMADVQAAIG